MAQNNIAVALAGASNEECLRKLEQVAIYVGLAEVRLDLMGSFDITELVKQSPIPLVVTYRPTREGGKYVGEESTRLDVLRAAIDAGAAYIDIEIDSLGAITDWQKGKTKVIASHHDFETTPSNLLEQYRELREQCDVVKLVGTAKNVKDNLAVFELLREADSPVVTMAMGETGRMTRILAPYFESCAFTYGAASEQEATAPGQMSVQTMIDDFSLDKLSPSTSLRFRLGRQWSAEWTDDTATFEVPRFDNVDKVLRKSFPAAVVLS